MDPRKVLVVSFAVLSVALTFTLVYAAPPQAEDLQNALETFADSTFDEVMRLRQNSSTGATSKNIDILLSIPNEKTRADIMNLTDTEFLVTKETKTDFHLLMTLTSNDVLNAVCNGPQNETIQYIAGIDFSRMENKPKMNPFNAYLVRYTCETVPKTKTFLFLSLILISLSLIIILVGSRERVGNVINDADRNREERIEVPVNLEQLVVQDVPRIVPDQNQNQNLEAEDEEENAVVVGPLLPLRQQE